MQPSKPKIKLFTWADFKLPKVIRKKLGRNKAWGQFVNGTVEVDERLKSVQELEIMIHELGHWLFPTWDEDEVRKHSRKVADFLWREGYRKIDSL